MKCLLGVVNYGSSKQYALPKLYECLEKCVKGHADILFVSDETHPFDTHIEGYGSHSNYSEDMTYFGREFIRKRALNEGYDAFIWQGVDCYYTSKWDFLRFLRRSRAWEYMAVGALTAARSDENVAVARRFTNDKTTEQNDIPKDVLLSSNIVPAGFPGADALLVKRPLMHESWINWEYEPWYKNRDRLPHSLCCEEFWCWKVTKEYGNVIGLDTSVRTWHAHEDGIARRWPGETKGIEELSWI